MSDTSGIETLNHHTRPEPVIDDLVLAPRSKGPVYVLENWTSTESGDEGLAMSGLDPSVIEIQKAMYLAAQDGHEAFTQRNPIQIMRRVVRGTNREHQSLVRLGMKDLINDRQTMIQLLHPIALFRAYRTRNDSISRSAEAWSNTDA